MKSRKISDIFKSTLSLVLIMALLITVVLPPLSVNATSGSWTGGQVNRGYRLMVEYAETEQNPQTNTSRVTATLYLVQDRTYSLYIGTRTATITINGVTTTISNIPAIRNDGNVTTELGSASTVVTHDANGKKTITIEATFDMNATLSGTYYGTMSTSETVELDNIDQSGPSVSLKFNSATSSSVNLTASANVTCDTWQYSLNGGSTWVTFGSSGSSNNFTISNLNGGTSYSVIVRARKASNQVYASSSTVSATTAPAAPGGLSMGAISQNYAILKWNAVTGANSYNLYLDGVLYATGVTGTAYQFTGLEANTDYTFGISATGSGGTSSITSTGHYVTLPNTPTELTVTSRNDRSVNLSWSYDKGGNAATTTFNIYRDGVLVGSSSSTSFTDATYGNSDCVYTVAAITSAGDSARSVSVSVTHVPLAITLQATNNGGYIAVTPSFVGGLNRTVDSNSLKWAYGDHDEAYFANNGYSFTNSFAVLRNGTYTVYAEDMDSDAAVQKIVISGIYIQNTEGAYTQTFTDLSVDATGIPISFERTYNSMLQTDGVFGRGWSFNYAKETHLSEDGTVRLVYLPDGTVQYFSVEDDGYSGINTQSKLIADGSKLTLTTKERLSYIYENGYLTRIEDANGNTVNIELDTDNNPVKITDSVGRTYTIAYNGGKITSIADPAGRIFTYIYDASGYLVAQKQASGSIGNKLVYTNGLLTKITDAFDNPITELQYNNQNQVVSIVESGEYTTHYLYKITTKGEVVIYESDSEIILDEMNSTTHPASNTYDAFGQLVVDADGLLYEYNEDGTICKIDGVNSDKTLIVYTYDEYGNVIHIVTTDKNELVIEEVVYTYVYFADTEYIASATEVVTTFTYDEFGEVTKTETRDTLLSSDRAGNILSERTIYDEVDESVSYKYTSSGLLQTESTDETITKYTYDSYGHITKIMVIEEDVVTTTTFCYNIIGQVISQTQDGLTSSNIYDLSGNVIKITQTDGIVTRISRVVYDSNDQVIQKISDAQYRASDDGLTADSNGIGITNIYNNSNVGERYTYDSNGNVSTYIKVILIQLHLQQDH